MLLHVFVLFFFNCGDHLLLSFMQHCPKLIFVLIHSLEYTVECGTGHLKTLKYNKNKLGKSSAVRYSLDIPRNAQY